jgi:hypothetical protein
MEFASSSPASLGQLDELMSAASSSGRASRPVALTPDPYRPPP